MAERYRRFPLMDRIEHWIQVVDFTVLAITGLVQKWPDAGISVTIIKWLGGIETTRIIHHWAAAVLVFAVIVHIGTAGYRFFVLGQGRLIVPGKADLEAAWGWIRYNLGLSDRRPLEDHFTFAEKIEYWSIIWGTAVMVVTGFMMWNPIATTEWFPGQFIPAAKVAHGWEAVLAVLAIIIWHSYHVHIRHFNKSIFTGYMDEEELAEEHPLELERIRAGRPPLPPVDPERVRRRLRIFLPAYAVVAVALSISAYLFLTFEKTAITTVPPVEQAPVYQPAPTTTTLPPTTTTAP